MEIRQDLPDIRNLSPTAFPGGTNREKPFKPLFPDMKRDEYMSKSTISTKETGPAGDYWSVSSASEDAFRSSQPINNSRGNSYGRHRDANNRETREHEDRDYGRRRDRRMEHAPDVRRDSRPVGRPGRPPPPRENFHFDEVESPRGSRYDDGYGDRHDDGYGGPEDRYFRDMRKPPPPSYENDFRKPQHMYEEDDYVPTRGPSRGHTDRFESDREAVRGYHEHRRERAGPTSPKPMMTPRSDTSREHAIRDHADYWRHGRQSPRGRSPSRAPADYSEYYTDEHEAYTQLSSRGKGPDSPRRGRMPARSRWDDEAPKRDRQRAYSRGRSTSRERPASIRDYDPPEADSEYGSRGKERDHRSGSRFDEDYPRRDGSRIRRRDYADDDDTDVLYQFDVVRERRGRRRHRYDDDDPDDDSSASSLDASVDFVDKPRSRAGRSRSRARSQRGRSRSLEKRKQPKEPSEFVIDISQPEFESESLDRGVTFSPSTEVPRGGSAGSVMSDEHFKRIADANLMKEQSEARHQILREVRQAMDMRDLAVEPEDRLFWDRQVSTLNASLRRLWDNHAPESGIARAPAARQSYENSVPRSQNHHVPPTPPQSHHVPPKVVNSYTTVKVQAPDNLPAGHQFTIRVNGKPMKAQVPGGGVRKGDVFTIRVPLNAPPTPTRPPSPSVIKVRAPASLPGGYRFTAKMGDRTIVATVPPGGVQKGEIFAVPALDQN